MKQSCNCKQQYCISCALPALAMTVSHQTLSDQMLKMSSQFRIMVGHSDQTSHQHIMRYLLQRVVSQ